MRIVFDHDLDALGNPVNTHFIETTDPIVQTMLTAFKGNAAAQATGGYALMSKLPAYSGQTRWQAILGEVVRLNDATARGLLGV